MQLRKNLYPLRQYCYSIGLVPDIGDSQTVPQNSGNTLGAPANDCQFLALVEAFKQSLFGFFLRLCADRELAETLAVDTFLGAYRIQQEYADEKEFAVALYRVAVEIASRPEWRVLCIQHLQPHPTSPATTQERARAVRRSIAELPERERIAVLLHKYQGMNLVQIAAILSLTISEANLSVFRAYELLRESLLPIL